MRTSLSTIRTSLVAGSAVAILTLSGASAASAVSAVSAADRPAAARAAAAVAGAPITSLPFYGSGTVTGAGTGLRGTAAANTTVATACNAGAAISGAQWYALPAATLGRVAARVDAPFYPRGVDQNPSGVAFVDAASGAVLACGSRAVDATARRRVAVVAYYTQPVDQCVPGEWCADGSLRLYVAAVPTTAPTNDHWQQATTIRSLPFTATVDTSIADDDGPAVFDYEHCLRSAIDPVQRGTVWWRYKPTTTGPAPSLAVDLRTPWGGLDPNPGFNPRAVVAELTPAGPVPAPRPDPEDCDSPLILHAGHTYLIGVHVFADQYYDATPVTGGPISLRVGAAPRPRVPRGLSVAVDRTARRATLHWAPPAAATGVGRVTGYRVWTDRRTTRGTWAQIAARGLPATARSLTVKDLTSSQGYRLRVSAVNGAGPGCSGYEILSPR
jgi:hypothetical protein